MPNKLPDNATECPKCREWTMRDRCPRCGRALKEVSKVVQEAPQKAVNAPTVVVVDEEKVKKGKTPNETEQRYYETYLKYKDARYEALTFHMANGHKYTPDWIVFEVGRPIECIECKGGYRFHSQGRARLAFDQARQEFNGLRWTWAKWDSKAKKWEVER